MKKKKERKCQRENTERRENLLTFPYERIVETALPVSADSARLTDVEWVEETKDVELQFFRKTLEVAALRLISFADPAAVCSGTTSTDSGSMNCRLCYSTSLCLSLRFYKFSSA